MTVGKNAQRSIIVIKNIVYNALLVIYHNSSEIPHHIMQYQSAGCISFSPWFRERIIMIHAKMAHAHIPRAHNPAPSESNQKNHIPFSNVRMTREKICGLVFLKYISLIYA